MLLEILSFIAVIFWGALLGVLLYDLFGGNGDGDE